MSAEVEFQPLASSAIARAGYDARTKTLHLQFHSNPDKTYRYGPFEPEHFDELLHAESAGQHFHRHIRGCEIRGE